MARKQVTVEKIGQEDFDFQADDTAQETFSRTTSTGGNQSISKVAGDALPWTNEYTRIIRPGDIYSKGPWADIRAYGASTSETAANNTTCIQAAFDSGKENILIPYGTYNTNALSAPSTVRKISGSFATLNFQGSATSALACDIGNGEVSDLDIVCDGTYTNGIYITSHPTNYRNVRVRGAFANLWNNTANNWLNYFDHCRAHGSDTANSVGWLLGSAANGITFVGCSLQHCDTGCYIEAGSTTSGISFHGGDIEYNITNGVKIGDASGIEIKDISFHGTYFEAQPTNVLINSSNLTGLSFFGGYSYGDITNHVKLATSGMAVHGLHIFGGSYNTSHGAGSNLIDFNSAASSRGFVIDTPYLYGWDSHITNVAGNTFIDYRTYAESGGTDSYKSMGRIAQIHGGYWYSTGFTTKWYDAAGVLQRTDESFASVTNGTAAPTTGARKRGDIRWNRTPSAGGPPGWVCVTAGTPGTWKAMANLAV